MNPMVDSTAPSRNPALRWLVVAVVVIALAAAAWYYSAYYGPYTPSPQLPTVEDAATLELETQGTSDEIGAIEQDLNATDLEGLDQELSDIEAELVP